MPAAFEGHRATPSAGSAGRRMPARRPPRPGAWAGRRAWLAACLGGGLVVASAAWWSARRAPPQLPDDPAVFKTTSALWTAVCSHDPQAVAACQQRLEGYRKSQRLPPQAARRLERIIHRAQAGDWDAASHELYEFMLGQRRQGNPGPTPVLTPSSGGV